MQKKLSLKNENYSFTCSKKDADYCYSMFLLFSNDRKIILFPIFAFHIKTDIASSDISSSFVVDFLGGRHKSRLVMDHFL